MRVTLASENTAGYSNKLPKIYSPLEYINTTILARPTTTRSQCKIQKVTYWNLKVFLLCFVLLLCFIIFSFHILSVCAFVCYANISLPILQKLFSHKIDLQIISWTWLCVCYGCTLPLCVTYSKLKYLFVYTGIM